MKLVIATLRDSDEEPVSSALTAAHFRVTVIASTSDWIHKGVKILLIGVEDKKTEGVLKIIRQHCSHAQEKNDKKAVILVLPVHEYIRF